MAVRNIVQIGDDVLRKKCRPVEQITPKTLQLLDDMAETMRAAQGVGLAAPQVGILRRIVVVEVEEGNLIELINPKIIAYAGEQVGTEGCLSVPGKWGTVKRPMHVTVRALNRHGEEFEITGSEFLARAFCHELDHLDGVLFLERSHHILSDEELADLSDDD